jgi:hypothetical protein
MQKKLAHDAGGPLPRWFRRYRDGRKSGSQVQYPGIGQRLGDDAHDFVGALAENQLFNKCFKLPFLIVKTVLAGRLQ